MYEMCYFPGQVLAVRARYGVIPYTHYGVVGPYGEIIHNCAEARRVIRSGLNEFAKGRSVAIISHNSLRASWQIACEADRLVGQPYDLFRFNCEHFWRHCAGLPVESPQVAQAGAFAAMIAMVGVVAARAQ